MKTIHFLVSLSDDRKTVDRPPQTGEAERADESGDELDFRQEELDRFAGILEGDDELEPVKRMNGE